MHPGCPLLGCTLIPPYTPIFGQRLSNTLLGGGQRARLDGSLYDTDAVFDIDMWWLDTQAEPALRPPAGPQKGQLSCLSTVLSEAQGDNPRQWEARGLGNFFKFWVQILGPPCVTSHLTSKSAVSLAKWGSRVYHQGWLEIGGENTDKEPIALGTHQNISVLPPPSISDLNLFLCCHPLPTCVTN